MLRDLLKEGGLYTIANLLTKGVSLLLIPFYTAYFTPSDYGILEILYVFGGLVNALVSFQIYQGVSRYLAEPEISTDDKSSIGSTAIFFVLFSYTIACGLLIYFSDFFIDALSTETEIPRNLFILSMIAAGINAMFYSLGIQLRFLRKATVFAISSFLQAIFTILLTLYFVIIDGQGLIGVFWASIIVTPLIVFYQIYALSKHLKFTFSTHWMRKIFIYSYPLIPAALAYLVLNFTDRVFVKEILDFHELGLYSIASKFASIISILVLGFASALTPLVYESYQNKDTKPQLITFFNAFFAIGAIGILAMSVFSKEILIIFTAPAYQEAYLIMPILFLGLFFTGLNMFSPGLYIEKKTKKIGVIVVICSLINIGLNAYLIPEFGLYGAAFSTLLALGLNNFSIYYLADKEYPIGIKLKHYLLPTIILLLLIYVGNYRLNQEISENFMLTSIIKCTIVVAFAIYLHRLNILNVQLIKKIFTKKETSKKGLTP
jgi:O-antigen/teichoic acid export membrane protein